MNLWRHVCEISVTLDMFGQDGGFFVMYSFQDFATVILLEGLLVLVKLMGPLLHLLHYLKLSTSHCLFFFCLITFIPRGWAQLT